ncbi:membrane dipeptidase [Viridibacillus sp. YIM B01967]|uniref:Membrane dipeptidase n=1 Tax=Viridibacillus soli TaxID=2798301 RepID=A0ABS1H9M1_9BACL|nr:dipeptidase [Viridibacillus soli]MBK3496117.1 membrane dipeptidase [Viridibacillus soli]
MDIIDLHCDVLFKMSDAEEPLDFKNAPQLQANLDRLKKGKVKVQVFAIFVDETVPQSRKYLEAIRQIELFQTQVLAPNPEMVHITDWHQLERLQDGEIGAILSLEGCDAIGADLFKLQAILDAGVKLVGLTWNNENAVAYGAQNDPNLGLKDFAKEVLALLNERDILIDVSHLNMQGFWDLLPIANHIIASHSNARALCDHPRNLTDEQAKALIEQGGHIHLVYYPGFIVDGDKSVTMDAFIQHFIHLADVVGVEHLGIGSDFDGIPYFVENLHNASQAQNLIGKLQEHFSEDEVKGIASNNFLSYVKKMQK